MPADLQAMYYEDGSAFYPDERLHPGGSPFQHGDGLDWEDHEIIQFAAAHWNVMYEAKRAEIERLKTNSLFVDGFHYADPRENRQNAITNRIYQAVEAQVAAAISEVPRPEIVARGGGTISADLAERLEYFAEYIEDTDNFDHAVYLGARDKFIYGYNVWLISFDYESGMPFVKNVSVFDWYWDPAARNEDELSICGIGMPVGTHRLRAFYPHVADDILPDRIGSPSWAVTTEPWRGFMETQTPWANPLMPDTALAVHLEGETPTQSISLVQGTGYEREYGHTTFLIQLFIRDEALVDVCYTGTLVGEDGVSAEGQHVYENEPRCESGWWTLSITASGVILERPTPVDPCFLGIPVVVDRNQQRTDRYESMAEVDQCIPIQRGLNRRKRLMMRALELAANPPLKATNGGLIASEAQRSSVAAGELIQLRAGADLSYLEYGGPSQQQFEMQSQDATDMEAVAGSPDVQRGVRPSGIEAASAIARLDDNSMRRMQAKEPAAHRARALLLRKLMYCAGKKLQANITFMATNGQPVSVTGEELCSQYHVRFARKSGMAEGKQQLEDKALMLGDKGWIDQAEVLRVFNWQNRDQIVARTTMNKIAEIEAAAKASAAAGGPGESSSTPVAAAA